MIKIIWNFFIPVILTLYLIVDILIPSFTKKNYFWFIKSFFPKPIEKSLEDQILETEQEYKNLSDKLNHLSKFTLDEQEQLKKKVQSLLKKSKELREKSEKMKK